MGFVPGHWAVSVLPLEQRDLGFPRKMFGELYVNGGEQRGEKEPGVAVSFWTLRVCLYCC